MTQKVTSDFISFSLIASLFFIFAIIKFISDRYLILVVFISDPVLMDPIVLFGLHSTLMYRPVQLETERSGSARGSVLLLRGDNITIVVFRMKTTGFVYVIQ